MHGQSWDKNTILTGIMSVLLIGVLVGFGYVIYQRNFSPPKGSKTGTETMADTGGQPDKISGQAKRTRQLDISQSPFWIPKKEETAGKPEVFAEHQALAPLPAIPNRNALPEVGAVPLPPPAPAMAVLGVGRQPRVAGVCVSDKGTNTAILNDGTVVSAGQNYGDNRIAWIGGDGIHFDDGSHLPYNK